MNDTQQDLAWAAIPTEIRALVRSEHKFQHQKGNFTGCQIIYNIFGRHNIENSQEPEEMLTVSRAKVIEAYDNAETYYDHNCECMDANEILESLFGKDKCLPDPKLTEQSRNKEQQDFAERILMNPDRPTDEEIWRDMTGEIPLEAE